MHQIEPRILEYRGESRRVDNSLALKEGFDVNATRISQRNMNFSEGRDKYPMVDSGLNPSPVKSKSMNPVESQIQTLNAEASSPSVIKDEVLEDDESIIGGTDVSALVRKVPSEPNLRRAVRMIDIVMDRNIRISINTFSALLQRCSRSRDLESGKKVHEQLLENNYKANVLLANMLIDMYGKCCSVEDAQKVFDEMSKHNIYSWTALISAYANKGMLTEAVKVFMDMQSAGNKPDKVVFVILLQACASKGDLNQGKQLHRQIRKNGLASDLTVGNTLIDMYAKCGSLKLAHEVFNLLPEHNVVSWTALIAGYAREGHEENAFRLFEQMLELGIEPNEATFVSILQACVYAMDVERGEHIHYHIISSDYESDLVLSSSLVDMYIKCGNLVSAGVVFNKMYERNIVTWNSMIVGHVQQGLNESALLLYKQLQEEGFESADEITYANVIKACSNLTALQEGQEVHHEIIKGGHDEDTYVGNSLISLYSCCNCINEARRVFDAMMDRDVVSWTAMIMGYAQQGLANDAKILFYDMRGQNLIFEVVSFVSLIKACALVGDLEWGRQLHTLLIDCGLCLDAFVGSVLIDMYANCGSVDSARFIFHTMPQRDVISYTAMIAGLAQQGQAKEALSLFEIMQLEGVEPDRLTFVGVLQACASLAAMDKGGQVHIDIIDRGLEMDLFVASTLVDMYAKCGRMDLARHISMRMPELNAVSWNALISGYSQQGHGEEAVMLFKEMLKEGLKPTGATLVSVLSACSHAGFVDEGRHFFDSIPEYGIAPTMDHYACMVDLLCRAGHMVEAENFILKMPVEPSEVVWMTLACAYKLQGKVDQAKKAIEEVLKLNPKNLSAYVLLSNILAAAGMWEEKNKVRQMMENQGIANVSEHSSVEVHNQLYAFSLDDLSHPQMKEIDAELERLHEEMQKTGDAPETGFALHNVAEVCHHSERLAIGLGLISTPEKSPIRVIKNVRVCSACHRLSKFISKFTGREILVRDMGCFHLFKNGTCSCRDYW